MIEPQNIEQGKSNFEVFFLTSAVRYSLFDIRNSKVSRKSDQINDFEEHL